MDVGVRELKRRLSELLDRASRGEVIRVTDRGQAKAVLGPLPGKLNLDEGIAAKWIRPGKQDVPRPVVRQRSVRSTGRVLADDRGR